jgi:hypothetical protein
MAKVITKKARVETAYGKVLESPIDFSYSYEELQKGEEIPAKEMPDADDLISFVNQKRNATARSREQNLALENAGVKKPTKEDPEFRLRTMVDMLVANGETKEDAEQQARLLLKM